ncbi:MAG: EAL domain-containing protein [Candidatus Sedimenticola sp. (ex Thyasira tokunagai)]
MFKFFSRLNITYKYAIFLMLMGVVPLLTAGLVAYQTAKEALVAGALKDQVHILEGYRDNLVLIQEQIESLIANISSVEAITDALLRPQRDITIYEQLATEAQVGYILNGYLNVKGLVSIYVSGEQGSSFQVGDTLDTRTKEAVRDQIKQEARGSQALGHWVGVTENISAGSSQKYVLAAAQTMYSTDRESLERKPIGTLIVNFSTDSLSKLFGMADETARYYLIDQNNRYIFHPDRRRIGQDVGDYRQGVLGTTQRHVLVSSPQGSVYQTMQPVERSGWMLLSEVPRSALLAQVDLIRNATIGVFTLALIFVGFVALYFSNSLVSPIKYITKSFQRLKAGETNVEKLPVPGVDEISQLAQWFNQFLDELHKRHNSEEALRLSEERYELVSRATNEGIWDLNHEVKSVYFSDRFKEIVGYKPDELKASLANFYSLIHPEDRPYIRRRLKEFLRSKNSSINVEHRMSRHDGSFVYVSNNCQAIRDKRGKVIRMAGSIQDVSLQKEIEGRLRHDASHDPLTGLYNRQWMLKRISRELVEYRADPEKEFAVLFLDLDDFKKLNDTLGHSYGDLLLIEVSKRIEACIRPGDSLARLGGDEFIVLLPNIKTNDALQVINRLTVSISDPYYLYHHECLSHSSIGVAFSKTGYDNADEILRDADTAMYRAKSMGKGRYEIFDNEMRSILLARTSMEKDLTKALDKGELKMYFQPIHCLKTDRTIGFESLIRWHHPNKGISPDIFIPLAEESNLIHPLGHWIFGEVVRQTKAWSEQFKLPPDFKVAVNISPKQFTDPGLIGFMKQEIAQYQLDASYIAVELTETAIFRDKLAVLDSLTQLKDCSISIHLDDFGTGYSSLSYLSVFPISAIKIDKSFVSKIADSQREERLVNTLILLAGELDIKVIAEGVEKAEQMNYLRARACDYAQGYYINKPLPANEATEILSELYSVNRSVDPSPRW